ncbi:MAG: carboxypeptidase-like regulatory domain-containing protein [Thermoplasmatota archaeon]
MRTALPLLLLLASLLAGCADGGGEVAPTDDVQQFDDLGVEATETTGIILGVVVDASITPIAGATVTLTSVQPSVTQKTDSQGRFAFEDLEPGTYLLQTTHPQFASAQSSAEVVAGVDEPRVVRVQLERLFDQNPFSEIIKFDGFLACAYSFFVSSTCVNDYTRVTGEQCTPAGCYCAGGCFRDQNLSQVGGNIREYVSSVGPGWQTLIIEETWEPTSDAGQNLGFTVSYFARPNAGHWFGSVNGPNPIRIQFDVGVEHGSASYAGEEPSIIPPEGYNELFVFFGAGDESLVLNQRLQSFQTSFYYGIPPEGWSFVNGDPMPF